MLYYNALEPKKVEYFSIVKMYLVPTIFSNIFILLPHLENEKYNSSFLDSLRK